MSNERNIVASAGSGNSVIRSSRVFVSPTEPAILRVLGEVHLLPEEHGVDIIDLATRTGIQRKTYSDLAASLRDGRLAKQTAQMQDSKLLRRSVLLIEGMPDSGFATSDFPYAVYQKLFLTLQETGMYYAASKDIQQTVQCVQAIFEHFGQTTHNSVRRPPTVTADWRVTMLQLFPGIGPKRAQEIVDKLGFPLSVDERVREIVGKSVWERMMKYMSVKE